MADQNQQPRDPETGEFLSDEEIAARSQDQQPANGTPSVEGAQQRYVDGQTNELALENELDEAMERERLASDTPRNTQPQPGTSAGDALDNEFGDEGEYQNPSQQRQGQQGQHGQQGQQGQQPAQQGQQQPQSGSGMNDPQRNAERRERRKNPPQQQPAQQSRQQPQQAQGRGQQPQAQQQTQGQQGPMAGMAGQNAPSGAQGMTPQQMAAQDAPEQADANSAQAMAAILGDEQTEHITIGYAGADFQFIIHEPDTYLTQDCQQKLPEDYTAWVREGVEEYGGLEPLQEALEAGERQPRLPNVDGECLETMHELIADSWEHDARDQHQISESMLKEFLERKTPSIYSTVLAMRTMAVGAAGENMESFRVDGAGATDAS